MALVIVVGLVLYFFIIMEVYRITLGEVPKAPPPPAGKLYCPRCATLSNQGTKFCDYCRCNIEREIQVYKELTGKEWE